MRSVFDLSTRAEILQRIEALRPGLQPVWGKMTVTQMVKHCQLCEEYYFEKFSIGRSFIGRIFGRMAIKAILKDEQAMLRKNSPTAAVFSVTENITDLEAEKYKWKSMVEQYATFDRNEFTHWFFGKMTREQLGRFIYKHTDHHLRQFGV